MTPYAGFHYFLFLVYPLLALVLLGVLGRLGRAVVLLASVAMVAFQYGDPLGVSATTDGELRQLVFLAAYAGGSIAVVRAYAALRHRHPGALPFFAAVGFALAPLVVARILPLLHPCLPAGPAVHSASRAGPALSPGLFDAFGFLGLSYMALRVVDAIIVLRDDAIEESPRTAEIASYLLFVPTISAGPIDRFLRFRADLHALPRPRSAYLRDVEAGIDRVTQGFLYKFVIATLIDRLALTRLAAQPGVLATVGYMYAYSFYLFFDFAGYSAFAIGVGRLFAIRVPENFNAPFRSRNFEEMWNRWHISLSSWMRDHVYSRFMLTAARRKWFGGNRRRAHRVALMLTMGLMGCWHGLAPQYVVYGLYQGVMLVGHDVLRTRARGRPAAAKSGLSDAGAVLVTVNLFCFGLLIFSGRLFPSSVGGLGACRR